MLGAPAWRISEIEVLISRACDPSLHEPNYATHLEIADYINKKKANVPREASMTIARLANNRNPHIAILALALLDTLVQSCGYPFHLQIATKEFLNELVRRFPERPPPFPGPVMSRILDQIHNWREGICTNSRWKEDLGNIRDMHKLLTFKGYRFRDIPRTHQAEPTSNLKSADELEAEDREAQSAKLQELIRRGTPRDLAAAQELMKSLAGANPDAKPDYRSQALTELEKLESKVVLLNEMLDNVDTSRGERPVTGDVYEQVASILVTARPKIQKWVSDAETDDPESLDTFLQINDQINSVLNRYEAFKRGDYVTSSNPIPSELQAPTSLIDFDDTAPANPNPGQQSTSDDLMSLFGPTPSTTMTTSSTFSTGLTNIASPSPQVASGSSSTMGNASLSGSRTTSMSPPAAIMLPGTPTTRSGSRPSYFPNGSTAGSSIHSGLGIPGSSPFATASPQQSQPQQYQQQLPPQQNPGQAHSQAASPNPVQGKDPFADLAGLF